MLPAAAPDRLRWSYLPGRRRGVTLMAMRSETRSRALALVRTGLSEQGWLQVQQVFELEAVLQRGLPPGQRAANPSWRNPLNYTLVVYGQPRVGGDWGWRFGGHHLSIRVQWRRGQPVPGTLTMGANPTTHRRPNGSNIAPLQALEHAARAAIEALPPAQRRSAQASSHPPGDLLVGPNMQPWSRSFPGVNLTTLTPEARAAVRMLVTRATQPWAPAIAKRLREGFDVGAPDQVTLSWRGRHPRGHGIHVSLASPRLMLEVWTAGTHLHSAVHAR